MGWNTPRVSLLPPRWTHVSTEGLRGRTVTGARVRISHTVPEESTEPPFPGANVSDWLRQRGFRDAERYKSSLNLVREDIEANVYSRNGELTHVTLTFTLSRSSFARAEVWRQFVTEVCDAWRLSLCDPSHDKKKAAPSDFFRLLSATWQWKDFQQACGWPDLTLPEAP
jgi:hypothetical protein